jgi:hypothetical protein
MCLERMVMGMITLPKELISKESILKLLKQYPTVLVNADSSSWLLSSEEDLPSKQWEEIRKELIEIEVQMAPQIGQQGHINGPWNAIMTGQKK